MGYFSGKSFDSGIEELEITPVWEIKLSKNECFLLENVVKENNENEIVYGEKFVVIIYENSS